MGNYPTWMFERRSLQDSQIMVRNFPIQLTFSFHTLTHVGPIHPPAPTPKSREEDPSSLKTKLLRKMSETSVRVEQIVNLHETLRSPFLSRWNMDPRGTPKKTERCALGCPVSSKTRTKSIPDLQNGLRVCRPAAGIDKIIQLIHWFWGFRWSHDLAQVSRQPNIQFICSTSQ